MIERKKQSILFDRAFGVGVDVALPRSRIFLALVPTLSSSLFGFHSLLPDISGIVLGLRASVKQIPKNKD